MTKGVASTYDATAAQYLAERAQLHTTPYVRKFLKLLPRHSHVLDLGCGAGLPVDDLILDDGHDVTGLDISPVMIEAARKNCPAGSYAVADIRTLCNGEYCVDGAICLYTFFHIPRGEQGTLLKKIRTFLPDGAPLLITMGDKDFEGTTPFYGQPMWWSQWGPEKNRSLVTQAGFDIILDELDHSGAEHHHFIIAVAR